MEILGIAVLIRDLEFGGIDTTVVVNDPVTLNKLRLNQ